MTSPIGSNRDGFTFVEVMVALVVLSAGIVAIYKSFFLCSDYLMRLSLRQEAGQIADEKIFQIKKYVQQNKDLSFERFGLLPLLDFNNRIVEFYYQADLKPVLGSDSLYELNLSLTWNEHGAKRRLSRSSILEVG